MKSVLFLWIDFTSVLSILQKSQIANNLITILAYSNDQNLYFVKNVISIDYKTDSLYKVHVQPTGLNP